MGEGGRAWGGGPIEFTNDSHERREQRQAREVLWQIFRRFSPNFDLPNFNRGQESYVHIAALFFADYLLDNIDLVRKLEDEFKNPKVGRVDMMKELEQRARKWA